MSSTFSSLELQRMRKFFTTTLQHYLTYALLLEPFLHLSHVGLCVLTVVQQWGEGKRSVSAQLQFLHYDAGRIRDADTG